MNAMVAAGVVERYAIGGAVGATFYLEPVSTEDVDIFVALRPQAGSPILSLEPIDDFLRARGCVCDGEHIVIADWPVQFLVPPSPLVEEALAEARETEVDGSPAWVLSAEHLAAIALETARPKDRIRLLQFAEAGILDQVRFMGILGRHGLLDRWGEFERRFLS